MAVTEYNWNVLHADGTVRKHRVTWNNAPDAGQVNGGFSLTKKYTAYSHTSATGKPIDPGLNLDSKSALNNLGTLVAEQRTYRQLPSGSLKHPFTEALSDRFRDLFGVHATMTNTGHGLMITAPQMGRDAIVQGTNTGYHTEYAQRAADFFASRVLEYRGIKMSPQALQEARKELAAKFSTAISEAAANKRILATISIDDVSGADALRRHPNFLSLSAGERREILHEANGGRPYSLSQMTPFELSRLTRRRGLYSLRQTRLFGRGI